MGSKYLVAGGYVATMDAKRADVPDGAVLVQDGLIKAVGRAVGFNGVDAEFIDAVGGVIMRGMVDTHRHTCAAILRGIGADHSLFQLINNAFTRYFPVTSADDLYTTCLVGAIEALENVVTTERSARINFARAYSQESTRAGTARTSWRSEATTSP